MIKSFDFLRQVVDSISEHIVVVDGTGAIVFTNTAWKRFGRENQCLLNDSWQGVNYLAVCDQAAAAGDVYGENAASGIRQVREGRADFYFEYPCHGPEQKRWFMMRVTRFVHHNMLYLIIAHINITERKQAEELALNLARTDGLTGLANRRHFDAFYGDEWKRCARLGLPLSLAMIDIDYFKALNDTYGHLCGDQCLARIGAVLKGCARRPGDMAARYGGEEFVLLFGNCSVAAILPRMQALMEEIRKLQIANEKSSVASIVTVSIGLAMCSPGQGDEAQVLLGKADTLLYRAKDRGRNRIEY